MRPFRSIQPVLKNLPPRLKRFSDLAYNLWWTWNPAAQRLFNRLDNALWESINHNPLLFLRQVQPAVLEKVCQDVEYMQLFDSVLQDLDEYLGDERSWHAGQGSSTAGDLIAYFSMEYGLHETLPIYSGGLGVLAGDHLKEASDLGLPLVGVGLLYSEGYFTQRIDADGRQEAVNNPLDFKDLPFLPVLDAEGRPLAVEVDLPGGRVCAQIRELRVGRLPLYLLDSNHAGNPPGLRQLTARLYWSDQELRIMQEMLLGLGGVRMLRALGLQPNVWHMNEGHAAFLTLERAREIRAGGVETGRAFDLGRAGNVFTTHTPVPAGNDEFPPGLVEKYLDGIRQSLGLDRQAFMDLGRRSQRGGDVFSMGVLALRQSTARNAVSELHGQVSRRMWHFLWPEKAEADVPIGHITNGIHPPTWMTRRMGGLLDRHLGTGWLDWPADAEAWEKTAAIPPEELWAVRMHQKRKLVFYVTERARQGLRRNVLSPAQVIAAGAALDPYCLTIGFARRFATYKRADLILRDLERLMAIIHTPNRPVQIIFAGKAHPADEPGKRIIQEVCRIAASSASAGRIVFLEDYDINLARFLVQGVDVWLNTPRRPNEASGTSGMKAAINGALNLSILDGWWREAYDGENGWAIGTDGSLDRPVDDGEEADSLYSLLEEDVLPLYYSGRSMDGIPHRLIEKMKRSIRTILPRFSTRRMVKQYLQEMYLPVMADRREAQGG